MKTNAVIIFFILLVAQIFAVADEISVVDVKRNITLADDEPSYKDFYVNAGEGSGLKKNLVVNVKRKLWVKDAAAKPVGDFETVVGQLRIIHVDAKVAVAREYKLQPREEDPMLEQIGIMTGDRVDLAGSFTDTKPIKRKTASAPTTESSEVADATKPVNSNAVTISISAEQHASAELSKTAEPKQPATPNEKGVSVTPNSADAKSADAKSLDVKSADAKSASAEREPATQPPDKATIPEI